MIAVDPEAQPMSYRLRTLTSSDDIFTFSIGRMWFYFDKFRDNNIIVDMLLKNQNNESSFSCVKS